MSPHGTQGLFQEALNPRGIRLIPFAMYWWWWVEGTSTILPSLVLDVSGPGILYVFWLLTFSNYS